MRMAQMSAALFAAAAAAAALLMLVSPSMVSAKQYLVGDIGWGEPGVDYGAWAASNIFYIGDVLIFHYDSINHNVVVATDSDAYEQCFMAPNLGVYTTANDELYLNDPGNYYFMCEHRCPTANMKMIVTVNN